MKISACYIVKNEEKNLPASIESLQSAVDEIIVVDTGSTDGTVEIAKKYGAQVFHFDWCDDFSAPRNFALEKAAGDWIIFPDADESFRYPEMVREAVEEFAADDDTEAVMVHIYNQTGTDENDDAAAPIWICRIFRNREDLRYRGRIHENISKNGKLPKFAYADERLSIFHTGYRREISEEKAKRNLALLEREVRENGEQPGLWLYFVPCYFDLKQYDEALRYARLALDSQAQAITGRTEMYHMAIESLRQMNGSLEEMLQLADAAVSEFPDIPEFHGERGMILCGMGRLSEAEEALLKSIYYFENPVEDIHVDRYFTKKTAAIVYSRLGELFMMENNMEEAAAYFDKALSCDDKNQSILEARNRFLHQAVEKLMKESEADAHGGAEK